ncbi:hypothetical protein BCR42DRAFT_343981 [Absidia repens]|uniref:PWWP domain-containing protein n=1 Tax=Absidia repens TaxID=90262 RepID=A0A1X2IWH0_9FUNG|nr:hypothetical protein BCR42DRAFT_343981 [Absidia repens]
MAQQQDDAYPPGTIVFAKLKGYPWWPAKIEDERMVPFKVMKQKTKAKAPLWTVFFFGSKDYGFFGPDSIRPFDKANVEKDLKAKKFKTKDLELAVREALNPALMEDGIYDFDDDHGKDNEQEEIPQGEKKSTRKDGKKATSARAKSSETALGSSPASAKKSGASRASSDEDMDTQSNKHKNDNKRGITESSDSMDKKKRRKSLSMEKENHQSSGNDHSSTTSVSSKDNVPLEITREFKRMYHLRHRLQKLMYEKEKGSIPLDDYPKISQTLKDVEEAPMTYDLLRHTKIGKVVKCGINYEFENDTEFNIQERCQHLMRKWKETFVESKDQVKANDTAPGHNKEPLPVLQE